jgi:hypothetical protein
VEQKRKEKYLKKTPIYIHILRKRNNMIIYRGTYLPFQQSVQIPGER